MYTVARMYTGLHSCAFAGQLIFGLAHARGNITVVLDRAVELLSVIQQGLVMQSRWPPFALGMLVCAGAARAEATMAFPLVSESAVVGYG